VQVRSRRWLVEEVAEPPVPGHSAVVRLACADDDAQGQVLDVFWNYEPDRLILQEEAWGDLAARGVDPPRRFAAFLVVMPGIGGLGLAEYLAAERPEARIILMSGDTGHSAGAAGAQRTMGFVHKPFSPGSLLEAVRDVLTRAERRESL